MKDQKEPRAVIMQSWIESIHQAVPDNEERCRVYEYIFAECMRIGYGIPHELTKPDGAGGVAICFILPQVERMCSKYAETEEKLMQNLAKANAAKAAKAAKAAVPNMEYHIPTEEEYKESF